MSGSTIRVLVFVGALILIGALPFVGHALRTPPGPRCAGDGVTLVDAPVVTFVDTDGSETFFCCVGCARLWPRAHPPQRVLVTDGTAGRRLNAREAWFVRSQVVAQPATGDRIHAFASKDAATGHAAAYRGLVLSGEQKPFASDTGKAGNDENE